MAPFDPYHKWLGIPPQEQPAHHYRLLAITDFEVDRDVISAAAERQTIYLRTLQAGEHAVLVAELLNEVSQARVTLLNADQKAVYDEELREQQTPEAVPEPTPPPIPVVQTPEPPPSPVVGRGTVAQEFPAAIVPTVKKPHRRGQNNIWKQPAVIGISLVGVIGVFVLLISLMSSEDAEPVASNSPPVVISPPISTPQPQPQPQPQPEPQPEPIARTLAGHSDLVRSVAFSPDGETIASGSYDNTIKLWNVETGIIIKTLTGHSDFVHCVTFTPDGETIASGSVDETIKLWNIETGVVMKTLRGHSINVGSVAFSPDGKIIASASQDKTIKLWDRQIGVELKTLGEHSFSVTSVAFSPDGQTIASGSVDETIKLWDTKTGELLRRLEGHSGVVRSVAFSPDGKIIASGSEDNTIRLWNVETGTIIKTLEGQNVYVGSIAFSPDGQTIASGSFETIQLWDVKTGVGIMTLRGHSSNVNSVAFSPDGKTIASGGHDKTIKLWNLGTAPAQTTANTLPPSLQQGLVAYYPFNGNAKDESGNGNHGAIYGATLASDRFSHKERSFTFHVGGKRGANIWLPPMQYGNTFSVSLWAKVSGNAPALFNKKPAPNVESVQVFLIAGRIHARVYSADDVFIGRVSSQIEVDESRWLNLTVVYDGGTLPSAIGIYLDGQRIESEPEKVGRFTKFNDLNVTSHLGAHNGQAGGFVGSLDDIRIYNRALSAAEVKSLYDYESTPPASPIPTAPATESITNTIGIKLNLIPAGTFMMGSPEGEEGRRDNETQHKVTITKPFYMQTTEVTQGQWKEVMGTEPWKGESIEKGPNYAATYVSWDDAVAFCEKLSEKESKRYRLPTEAEWEYACRAGTTTAWSFGDDDALLGQYAWYDKNTRDIGEKYAHQVGLKKPNAFGLYDMHGNVFEWCHDFYGEDYYQQSPEKDPTGPTRGSFRALRGGSWSRNSHSSSSAFRGTAVADARHDDYGFRIVRELD